MFMLSQEYILFTKICLTYKESDFLLKKKKKKKKKTSLAETVMPGIR